MINNFIIKNVKYIHFVGIGGISMSGLAMLSLKRHIKVSGSDLTDSATLKKLKDMGAKISINHSSKNISGQDLVVYSGAIKSDNPELVEAKKQNIPCIERSEYLGFWSEKFAKSIAVGGTHGKTTTTSMLAKCFIDAKLKPEVHLGGEVDFLKGSVRAGEKIFITEACEYRKSFLKLKRDYAILLNMEADHLDYYKTMQNLQNSFLQFANKANILVTSYELFTKYKFKSNVITVSLNNEKAIYYAKNINLIGNAGGHSFEVYKNGQFYYNFAINVLGEFNVFNALCVIAMCDIFGIEKSSIYNSLLSFKGAKRRFENLGNLNNAKVIHDYAHHPTEISKVINAFRSYFKGELVVLFQPHTYSRTKDLLNEFIVALSSPMIDTLIMLPTYPAREKPKDGISAFELSKHIKQKRKNCFYMTPKKASKYLYEQSQNNNIAYLILGAGDIEQFARKLIKLY